MTPLVDGLTRAGLVDRRPNPADRRSRLVGLTAEGREVIDRAIELLSDADQEVIAVFTPTERTQLAKLLKKLLLSLEPPGQ